ncbi:MAG: hypothetical protein JWN34_4635 [Bryobacterales bacterium]|nr:hypothetical protein [Bryobacterales bacterium]
MNGQQVLARCSLRRDWQGITSWHAKRYVLIQFIVPATDNLNLLPLPERSHRAGGLGRYVRKQFANGRTRMCQHHQAAECK